MHFHHGQMYKKKYWTSISIENFPSPEFFVKFFRPPPKTFFLFMLKTTGPEGKEHERN